MIVRLGVLSLLLMDKPVRTLEPMKFQDNSFLIEEAYSQSVLGTRLGDRVLNYPELFEFRARPVRL